MPPKRKRAEANTTAEGSTTRSTRKSTRTTRQKNGSADAPNKASASLSNSIEPQSKKPRKKSTNTTRGTKAAARDSAVDDEPLNSTTSQPQSDNELDMPKQAPSIAPNRTEYTSQGAQALFKSFADDDNPDVIGPGGIERLCIEAGIPLEGAQPLILAWQFKAQEMAKLKHSEWLLGTEALRISSLPVLALVLKELDDLVIKDKEPITPVSSLFSLRKRDAVDSQGAYNRSRYWHFASDRNTAFAELYQFCFTLSKPPLSRNLDIETAMVLWSVLLTPRYPITTELVEFLNESRSYKGANKDIWNMVHEFCQTVNEELSNYEADGAWPTMLDDFVSWKRDKMARTTDVAPE